MRSWAICMHQLRMRNAAVCRLWNSVPAGRAPDQHLPAGQDAAAWQLLLWPAQHEEHCAAGWHLPGHVPGLWQASQHAGKPCTLDLLVPSLSANLYTRDAVVNIDSE